MVESVLSKGVVSDPIRNSMEDYLKIACDNSPVIDSTIATFGKSQLSDYAENLFKASRLSNVYQQGWDFLEILYETSRSLILEENAKKLTEDIEKMPFVLTANHHGVDYFAQSVQSSIIFALMQKKHDADRQYALVLSCGNVPLDNLTYPQGILLYDLNGENAADIPKKIPLFSNKKRRCTVSASPGYDLSMISRTAGMTRKMEDKGMITQETSQNLLMILKNDYADTRVIDNPSYACQSVVVNRKLWERFFKTPKSTPTLISFELEKITAMLVKKDIFNRDSLLWNILFADDIRNAVIKELNGNPVCWTSGDHAEKDLSLASGTHFFWGIDAKGRKYPLSLKDNGPNRCILNGVDNNGKVFDIPFTLKSLINHLDASLLLPSLFTCFLTIFMARGINCIGGYYQAEYLPAMQKGLVRAFEKVKWHDAAISVNALITNSYLSGMQTVMIEKKNKRLVPAGPLEIITAGGLSDDDLQTILKMNVRDAHLASLFETLPDVASGALTGNVNWKNELASLCWECLLEKVIVK
ncbi:MAG: hypothetical protein HQK77_05360 [Desulfobacterales bacterium]|nr:hypothetical protein [Desulfobacterales bacterium]